MPPNSVLPSSSWLRSVPKYENVPIVPRMSGSGSPASSSPLGTSSGGKVIGTVRTLERTPSRPARTQNDVPPRRVVSVGPAIGR